MSKIAKTNSRRQSLMKAYVKKLHKATLNLKDKQIQIMTLAQKKKSDIVEKDAQIRHLKQELQSIKQRLKDQNVETEIDKEIRQLLNKNEQTIKYQSTLKVEYERELAKMNATERQQENEVLKCRTHADELAKLYSKLQQEYEEQIATSKSLAQTQEKELVDLENLCKQLELENKNIMDTIQSEEIMCEEQITELTELSEKKRAKLEAELEEKRAAFEQYKESSEQSIIENNVSADKLIDELKQLEESIQQMQDQNESLSAQLEEVQHGNAQQTDQQNQQIENHEMLLKSQRERFENELNEIYTSNEQLAEKRKADATEMKEEQMALETRQAGLQRQVVEMQQSIDEHHNKLDLLRTNFKNALQFDEEEFDRQTAKLTALLHERKEVIAELEKAKTLANATTNIEPFNIASSRVDDAAVENSNTEMVNLFDDNKVVQEEQVTPASSMPSQQRKLVHKSVSSASSGRVNRRKRVRRIDYDHYPDFSSDSESETKPLKRTRPPKRKQLQRPSNNDDIFDRLKRSIS